MGDFQKSGMEIERVFDDGGDCDLDDFEFDLDLDDGPMQSTVPKRRKRRRTGPVVVSSTPVKGDIRRYLPQLMTSVINSTEFPKLHTFFQTFMDPDGKYDLEYAGNVTHSVCESRGPELTAFMITGIGVLFPDIALAAHNITISTNNVNAVSKITMDCSFNFSKIYDVTFEWALTQLQAAYQANKPDLYRDLHLGPLKTNKFSLHTYIGPLLDKQDVKVGKKRGRKRIERVETGPVSVPCLPGSAIRGHTYPLALSAIDGSTSSSACSSAPSSARDSERSNPDMLSLQSSTSGDVESGAESGVSRGVGRVGSGASRTVSGASGVSKGKGNSSTTASSYDLSGLAHSVFTDVTQLTVPVPFFAHCTFTIILDGNRIKSILWNATIPPKRSASK